MADGNSCGTGSAEGLVDFLNAAWTPFHATEVAASRLSRQGFVRLSERAIWDDLKPHGKYFFTRNASTIVAFAIGGKYRAGGGFRIIGAHTDSPCPKLKPVSKQTKAGCLSVNCQPYGGGLWFTWFDRDLTVAGRMVVRTRDASGDLDGGLEQTLVRIDRPIMRIPSLCIHLDRGVNDGLKVNFQNHVAPVLATSIMAEMDAPAEASSKKAKPHGGGNASASAGDLSGGLQQHPLLLDLLSASAGCRAEDIVDFDLQCCDTHPAAIAGAKREFIYGGRLDNLAMCFCAMQALEDTMATLGDDDCVRMIALYDHEECGSSSAQGAGSTITMDTIKRIARRMACNDSCGDGIAGSLSVHESVEVALQRSFLVSADMAHALHPNYQDRHEPQHGPTFHKGLVLKHNANQRYATNAMTAAMFRECGRKRGIPCQEFTVRSDMGCGSTIGPIVATGSGIRTVDVGIPQLSMHSIREMCGCTDVGYAVKHFAAFWEEMGSINENLLKSVDEN